MKVKNDAILIPGGGLKDDGSLHEWSKRRLDKGIEKFTGTEYLITLTRATTHKPPVLDRVGFPIDESVAAAKYLIKKGIPSKYILIENTSFDTIGNAYFARVVHCQPRNFKKLCVVSSKFHMPRTKVIFKWVFGLTPLSRRYVLEFIESADEGMRSDVLEVRRKKEAESLKKLFQTNKKIRTLSQFHAWIFTQHEAYSAGLKSTTKLDRKTLSTY